MGLSSPSSLSFMHHLIIRSKQNLIISDYDQENKVIILDKPTSKGVKYHENLMIYLDGSDLVIYDVISIKELKRITIQNGILDYNLSSSGRYLEVLIKMPTNTTVNNDTATTATIITCNNTNKNDGGANGNAMTTATNSKKNENNIFIYDLKDDYKLIKTYHHKNNVNWHIQWTRDGNTFAHLENGQLILESFLVSLSSLSLSKKNGNDGNDGSNNNKSESISHHSSPSPSPIRLGNIDVFSISPDKTFSKVAVFSKGGASRPDAIKIFLLPNVTAPVAQKVFFKPADRVEFKWSPNGRHVLVVTSTDVDTTGQSYYGLDNLYFISGDGSFTCQITLDKSGPIHNIAWNPNSTEFVVAYGFTPSSKVMLYNLKCQPVFEFDIEYSMNYIVYNPQSSLICMGGFGNLPGRIEIWSTQKRHKVASIHAPSTSLCEWSPDGSHILTATISPRLRVDNGYKIWSFTGKLVYQVKYEELYQVNWLPMAKITKDGNAINVQDVLMMTFDESGSSEKSIVKKTGAYRPPGLRKNAVMSSPSSTSTITDNVKNINSNNDNNNNNNNSINGRDSGRAQTNAGSSGNNNSSNATFTSAMTKEEKMIRKLKEKLSSIKELKLRQSQGLVLGINQLEKVRKESQIEQELQTLTKLNNK